MGKWTKDAAVLVAALVMLGAASGAVAYGVTRAAQRWIEVVSGAP